MSRYSRDMASGSYDDIIKGGKLPDEQVVIRTPAGAAPAVKTGGVSSVFTQGKQVNARARGCRPIDEIETIKMPPPAAPVVAPSRYEDLYYALVDLAKEGEGKKLTKKEVESLRRWCTTNKKKVMIRKLNNGPTPYGAWAVLPKEQP